MKRLLSILIVTALAGCASEGGVTGSGISAIVAGNVSTTPGSDLEGIEVAIGDAASRLDRSGNFELLGEFDGEVALRFRDAVGGFDLGELPISVASGSTTIIEGIVIDPAAPQRISRQIVRIGSVIGTIRRVDCGPDGGRVDIELAANGRDFRFLIFPDAFLRTRSGEAISCQDLRPRDRVEATGVQLADRTSIALVVTLTDRPPAPAREILVEFGGSVNRLFCDRDGIQVLVTTADEPSLASVRFRPNTEILCNDGDELRPCACDDILERDIVQIRGFASIDNPEAVRATTVLVFPGPLVVSVPVVALRVGCGQGLIETQTRLDGAPQVLIARVHPETEFVCGGRACSCRDLRPGDGLRLVGSPVVERQFAIIDVGRVVREEPARR